MSVATTSAASRSVTTRSAALLAKSSALLATGSSIGTTPGTRRRPRVASKQRPAIAPIPVRYQQAVSAGCAAPVEAEAGYRMGRWARLSVTITVVAAALVLTFGSVFDSSEPVTQQVTVAAGDTLWSIAVSSAPSADTRYIVGQIMELNGLSGVELPVGLVLTVPTGS